jgi:hypothetical protein
VSTLRCNHADLDHCTFSTQIRDFDRCPGRIGRHQKLAFDAVEDIEMVTKANVEGRQLDDVTIVEASFGEDSTDLPKCLSELRVHFLRHRAIVAAPRHPGHEKMPVRENAW